MHSIKNKIIVPVSFLMWSVASHIALAQAKCTVNGREVPCEEVFSFFKSIRGVGSIIFAVVVAGFAYYKWAAKRKSDISKPQQSDMSKP